MSKAILIALVLGIGAGVVMPEGVSGFLDTASSYMLLILLFSVGIDMGVNREVFGQIRRMGLRILVIPLGVILGSLAGGAVCAMILRMDVKEGLAITSGLGWYSLSGILMTEASGFLFLNLHINNQQNRCRIVSSICAVGRFSG